MRRPLLEAVGERAARGPTCKRSTTGPRRKLCAFVVMGIIPGTTRAAKSTALEQTAKLLGYHVDALRLENPYGMFKDAWIKIRAPLIPLEVSNEPEEGEWPHIPPAYMPIRLRTKRGSAYGAYPNLDYHRRKQQGEVERMELFALVIGWPGAEDVQPWRASTEASQDESDDEEGGDVWNGERFLG